MGRCKDIVVVAANFFINPDDIESFVQLEGWNLAIGDSNRNVLAKIPMLDNSLTIQPKGAQESLYHAVEGVFSS